MVDTPKTSFIPKQTIGIIPGRVPHRRRHFNIFGFMGTVAFLCGMILAVGVFLYKDFNEKALETKKQELNALKGSFSQNDIDALRKLDRRIQVASALLDRHLSPSVVFDALELRTQQGATFSDFSYSQRESGSVELALEGVALRFNTVALQSQQLVDAEIFARTVFSDLTIDEEGQVHFSVTGEGNNAALAYTAPTIEAPIDAMATTTATTTGMIVTTTATTTVGASDGPHQAP